MNESKKDDAPSPIRAEKESLRHLLEETWNVRLVRPSSLSSFDFVALIPFSNVVGGYVSTIIRRCVSTTYPNFFAYKETIERAAFVAEQNGVPFVFIVQFTDKTVAIRFSPEKIASFVVSETARGRPVFEIPISQFVRVSEIRLKGVE